MSGTCRDAWLDSGWLQFIQSSHFNCNKLITLFHLALTKEKETGSWMWLRAPQNRPLPLPTLRWRQPGDWHKPSLPSWGASGGPQRKGSQWAGSWRQLPSWAKVRLPVASIRRTCIPASSSFSRAVSLTFEKSDYLMEGTFLSCPQGDIFEDLATLHCLWICACK